MKKKIISTTVAIFQQQFTFHSSCVILKLVPCTVILSTELSCCHKSYSNQAMLFLGWCDQSKNYTVINTNWLTVAKYMYPFLKSLLIFSLLYRIFLSSITDKIFARLDCEKQELHSLRKHLCSPHFCWWCLCCSYFVVVCVVIFFCLHSVSCAQCCLCPWIVHSGLPLQFFLTFIVIVYYKKGIDIQIQNSNTLLDKAQQITS